MEGQWRNYYTGEEIDPSIGSVAGGISEDLNKNCAVNIIYWAGWTAVPCHLKSAHPATCGCEHPGQMYLQLRGLCPDSNIDRFYVPRNVKGTGSVQLLGLDTTIIEYDKDSLSWNLGVYSLSTTASTDAPLESFVLGSHNWLIQEDNVKCSRKGESYERMLKLTGCKEGEFTCSDGQCIRMEERCDQIINCIDESDENNCNLIAFKENYNQKVPPFTITITDFSVIPAKIRISTQLKNVLAISEFSHTIDLKLGITLKWYENRVLYHNLKTEEALNVLTDVEVFIINFKNIAVILQLQEHLGKQALDSLHYLPEY